MERRRRLTASSGLRSVEGSVIQMPDYVFVRWSGLVCDELVRRLGSWKAVSVVCSDRGASNTAIEC